MSDQLINAQETFGKTLGRWFALNAWPQSVTEGWAKAVGSENGPWSSQISPAMRNKILPKPHFFYALGEFNRFVHEKKDLNKITDRVLRDRLTHGEALCHPDGTPFDSTDFYGLFVGAVQPPEIAEPPPQITDESCKLCGKVCIDAFRDFAMAQMMPPAEAWAVVSKTMTDANTDAEDIEHIKKVISGWEPLTADYVKHLHKRYDGRCPFMEALDQLGGTNEAVELLRVQLKSAVCM